MIPNPKYFIVGVCNSDEEQTVTHRIFESKREVDEWLLANGRVYDEIRITSGYQIDVRRKKDVG